MADEQDQFYIQPQQQHVREIQQLQLPTPIYQKSTNQQQNKNITIKMLQPIKIIQYQYKRFKLQKKQSSQQQSQDDNNQQYDSPFLQYYNQQQLIYKKYHNNNIAIHKNTFYFSGTFVHQNIFTSNQLPQSSTFLDIAKQFYDIPKTPLPQDNITKNDNTLKFNSKFQSGNLFAAFKISNSQYDLVMENDTNSKGNNQWFYFSVENMLIGKQYTFNIVNFTKNDSLFNYGMQPAVYSHIQSQRHKDNQKLSQKYKNTEIPIQNKIDNQKVWKRMGLQVSYKKGPIPRQNSKRHYYKLSFKLISKFPDDKLFIAHSYPYTYTKLTDYLNEKCNQNKQIITKFTIGKTLSKKPIQILKISSMPTKKRQKDIRKAIIILSRQHPGQTQGSYVCQGTIQKIISKSKQGQFLRKNYIFYIIPMVNIDGVIYGHYRTNLSGKDLNRKWDSTQKQTSCPQVNAIKLFLAQLIKQRPIRFILDLHGHSKKLNSFFYGNPCTQNPQVVRIYPFICSKLTQAIQFYDCTFASEQYKRKAARVYLSYLYKLIHVYTFQSSFYAYFKDGKKVQFTPKQYRQLGQSLIQGLSIQLQHQIKYNQSFQFPMIKGPNTKQYQNTQFIKYLNELRQNKSLLEIGNQVISGSDSKPQQGQINQGDIQYVHKIKLTRPPSLTIPQEIKSLRLSRKGQRQIKQVNRPIRNMRFLQISKINSVLPDKYQLCLQPIRNQINHTNSKLNQTLKTSMSTQLIKQNSQSQTQRDKQQLKYKQINKLQLQSFKDLSNSIKIQTKPINLSNQRRYSSVIKTQNRNNIIFKIDFMTQQTREDKISQINKISKAINLKHAYSQTIISFNTQRQKQKQKFKQQSIKQQKEREKEKMKNSYNFLPFVDSPDRQQKKWIKNNHIKNQNVKIGNKRQAEIFLNGIVKKYLVQKHQPNKPQQPLTIFTKALERPKSLRKKDSYKK